MNNAVAQLSVNRLTIVPFTAHPVLQKANSAELQNLASIGSCSSSVL